MINVNSKISLTSCDLAAREQALKRCILELLTLETPASPQSEPTTHCSASNPKALNATTLKP